MDHDSVEHKQPLLSPSDEGGQQNDTSWPVKLRKHRFFVAVVVLQGLLSVVLLGIAWSHHMHDTSKPKLPYSPMEKDVRWEVRRWNTSIGSGMTEYMGQSDEVDARWEQLFKYGIDQIPKEEARLLADQTAPIPGDLDNYIFSYEVFHLLHCLNLLRKRFHPEYYPPPAPEDAIAHQHGDHCVDILRQSMMCTVDINPMVWQWDERKNMTLPKLDALHECRNWDDVLNWSVVHRLKTPFDKHLHLETGL